MCFPHMDILYIFLGVLGLAPVSPEQLAFTVQLQDTFNFQVYVPCLSVVLDQVNIWWKSYILKDHIYLSVTKM